MPAHKNTIEGKMDMLIHEKKRANEFLGMLCIIELLKYKNSLSLEDFMKEKEAITGLMEQIDKI